MQHSDDELVEPFIPPSPPQYLVPPHPPTLPAPQVPWYNSQEPPLILHPHLCYNPYNLNLPGLVWDVVHPPDFARIYDPSRYNPRISPDLDSEPFQITVRRIWVLSDHVVLGYWIKRWGPITIEADKITIKDVLQGIYTYLRTPLTHEDLQHVDIMPGNRDTLHQARAYRARDSYEIDAVVLASRFRRVDILGGHRRFRGFRIVVLPDNTWMLHLGLLPGTVPRAP
ncbi:hypothetical protein BYT27DRAFT_7265214 [Phlegmacium glaucopus]|nr:hypothetical protein BYT27DRAFT_7265214 [Phlegmacium glaucopus]